MRNEKRKRKNKEEKKKKMNSKIKRWAMRATSSSVGANDVGLSIPAKPHTPS